MNKLWIIALAATVTIPALALGGASPIGLIGPIPEQLVEGHTVFTILEVVNATNVTNTQFGAAVAVLVRQAQAVQINERFPGVLWFNDQYLVDPVDNSAAANQIRYPCVGAVQATNQGSLPITGAATPTELWTLAVTPTYIESYLVTDPNDHQWNVDRWTAPGDTAPFPVWTVAVEDNQAGYDQPDDGITNCDPYTESSIAIPVGCGPYLDPNGGVEVTGPTEAHCDNDAAAANPRDYPTNGLQCDGAAPANGCDLKYNALLFFYLEDLTIPGAASKQHCSFQANAAPPTCADAGDVSGCQVEGPEAVYFPDHWPCPPPAGNTDPTLGDDNQEGNSHPYNPFNGLPICPNCVGRNNHGGSGLTPPGSAQGTPQGDYSHATRMVDIYYGHNPAPGARGYRLVDTEGSTAPYFCEDGFQTCIPGDL